MIEVLLFAPIIAATWLMGLGAILMGVALIWSMFNDRR